MKAIRKAEPRQPGQIQNPYSQRSVNKMIPQNAPEGTELMVMFRIISRHSWDVLQGWHKACPGSTVEHLMKGTGLYVLILPAGGAGESEAA